MLRKPVTSSRSPSAKRLVTIDFVIWSATATAAARTNQRQALRIQAAFSRAIQVQLAAAAQRFIVHVRPVMPAAFAFTMLARPDLQSGLARTNEARSRREHHELEIVAEACERVVVGAVGAEF